MSKKKEYLCSVKQILKSLSVYGIAYFLLLMYVFGLQYAYPKIELHLWLNSWHTGLLDTFFKYYSMLAEGLLYVLALLPIFWKKKEMTIFFAISELAGGAIVQLLKFVISTQRPASVFENYQNVVLPVVEGVDLHHYSSFPSGHSSTFFTFFTCCAIILAYHYVQRAQEHNIRTWILFNVTLLVLLVLAALGGYSRIYLSQHFMLDVWVGSIIGFVMPFVVFWLSRKKILKLKNV